MSKLEVVADIGAGIVAVIAAAVGVALLAGLIGANFLVTRQICVTRSEASISRGDWHLSPQLPIATYDRGTGKSCEKQTWTQATVEKVPGVGDWMEQQLGGPDNPEYYRLN